MYKRMKNGRLKHIVLPTGYQPKGFITEVINGKEVDIPISEIKLVPPKGGSAVVRPDRVGAMSR